MKIVINTCYGGFGLSDEGVERYAKLKGHMTWREDGVFSSSFYIDPPGTKNRRGIWSWEIKRDDPDLVKVVEELGEKADGPHAALKVIDIPDGTNWELNDYDGIESIHEVHNSWDQH